MFWIVRSPGPTFCGRSTLACIPDGLLGDLAANCQANSKKFVHMTTTTIILSERTIQNGQLAAPVLPTWIFTLLFGRHDHRHTTQLGCNSVFHQNFAEKATISFVESLCWRNTAVHLLVGSLVRRSNILLPDGQLVCYSSRSRLHSCGL